MDASLESDKKFINHLNEQFSEEFLSKKDIELVEGDIMHTIENYVKKHPKMRIALLQMFTVLPSVRCRCFSCW